MLSSFTLDTPRNVARSATVIATRVLSRAFARSRDAPAISAASLADSNGSISIAGWPGILAGRHEETARGCRSRLLCPGADGGTPGASAPTGVAVNSHAV